MREGSRLSGKGDAEPYEDYERSRKPGFTSPKGKYNSPVDTSGSGEHVVVIDDDASTQVMPGAQQRVFIHRHLRRV